MNTFDLPSKFPKFFEQLKAENFDFVSFVKQDNNYEIIIVDAYGIKYQGYVSDECYEFDIDLFEVIYQPAVK